MLSSVRVIALSIILSASSVQAVPITSDPDNKALAPLEAFPGPGGGLLFDYPQYAQNNAAEQVPPEILAKLYGTGDMPALRKIGLALKQRLERVPNDPFLMHALATVMFYEGSAREARALWAAASKQESNLASAELMEGMHTIFILQAKGKSADAKKQLAANEKKYDGDPHFQLMRAEQAMRGKNITAAETSYRRAYKLAPKLYITILNLARFLDLAKNDTTSASRLYEDAARLAPKRPEVWNNYGVFLFRQGHTELALNAFSKVKSMDTDAPIPERRLGDLSASLERYEDARRWYVAALEQKPIEADMLAIRVVLGDVLLRLKRYDEARKEIETVLKKQELPPLVFALGTIDEAQDKTQAAEARYRQSLKLTPGNPLAANNLAMLLVKTGKAEKEALQLAEQANRTIPNNAIIQGTYGCALQHAGRNQEAIKVLEPVVQAIPKDAWARYCLGKGLLAEKRATDAKSHLQQVLHDDPKFPRRAEIEKINSVR